MSCLTLCDPWTAACQGSLSFTISRSLPKLMSTESVMPSNHLILCHSCLLLSSFPALGSFLMSWLFTSGGENFGASALVLPLWLISFRVDGFDLLAVQGTLKSLQHHSSKASIYSALFIVQLSHPYMTTGKTIALTKWTFVRKGDL